MTADQANEQAWVWLARIRKSQGRKGEVLAEILTDFPEKFAERKRVWLLSATGESAREATLENSWLYKSGHTGEILIPFAKSYLGKIDLDARRVEMALPGGLIEVQLSEKSGGHDDAI